MALRGAVAAMGDPSSLLREHEKEKERKRGEGEAPNKTD